MPSIAGTAKFCLDYFKCLKLLIKVRQQFFDVKPDLGSRIMRLSYKMEYGYLGLDSSVLGFIAQLRIIAHIIWWYATLDHVTIRYVHKSFFLFNLLSCVNVFIILIYRNYKNNTTHKRDIVIGTFSKRLDDLQR